MNRRCFLGATLILSAAMVSSASAQELNWTRIGHANDVVAMAAANNKLFAATSDDKLWMREPHP